MKFCLTFIFTAQLVAGWGFADVFGWFPVDYFIPTHTTTATTRAPQPSTTVMAKPTSSTPTSKELTNSFDFEVFARGKRSETVDVAQASPKKIGKTVFKFLPWIDSLFGIGTGGTIITINDGLDAQSATQMTPTE